MIDGKLRTVAGMDPVPPVYGESCIPERRLERLAWRTELRKNGRDTDRILSVPVCGDLA